MSTIDEEPYSTIFASLKHPIRRRVLRMLSKQPLSFSEMIEALGVSNSFLTYHLENLGELVGKTEDGRYRLSSFGEAAIVTMSKVEDIQTTALHRSSRIKTNGLMSRSVAVSLGIICILLIAGMGATILYYATAINNKQSELDLANKTINQLNATITEQHDEITQLDNMITNLQNQISANSSAQAQNETVYINSDGSVSPSSAPISSVDNVTYTFTGNISSPTYSGIVVERNNTVIDGNGFTLQGPDLQGVSGIELSSTHNVTIENANIKYFWCGVWLDSSVGNIISGNNVTNKAAVYRTYGIELGSSSNNMVYGNNMINYSGIELGSSSNNVVYGNNITNSNGVELDFSSNNTVYGNSMTDSGVWLYVSSNNAVCANNITGGSVEVDGCSNNLVCRNNITSQFFPMGSIELEGSSNNTISENTLANNWVGVWLVDSSNNTVFENSVTGNAEIGIELTVSSNNTVVENTVANNYIGINLEYAGPGYQSNLTQLKLTYSSGNLIYHNNFINNTQQAIGGWQNVWDNGYPSGGNYWSDYNGTDLYSGPYQNVTGSDGIGDTPYVIDVNNTDNYPLMGEFSDYSVAAGVDFQVVSNSTVSDFEFNGTAILFSVSGANHTTGFCSLRVPIALLNGTLTVFVNGTEVQFSLLPSSNSTISYVYFTYDQSTEQVTILPEFPDSLIMAMFMLVTLSAIAIRKKKHSHS
ncbi:MAG TPA: NosD domain-containing protein [Candidatus Acidoferrales bacterium]|nr:NosD domain-containing protein [Candidatus Acidoferrales bacterium]